MVNQMQVKSLLLLAGVTVQSISPAYINNNIQSVWFFRDQTGMVLPHFTKPFLDQLQTWNIKSWRVFHWGHGAACSGYASAWFAKNCRSVTCVEYQSDWHTALTKNAKKLLLKLNCLNRALTPHQQRHPLFGVINANLMNHGGEQSPYVKAIFESKKPYDCIIIDGMHRRACIAAALQKIKPGGIIIINNVNRTTLGINDSPALELLAPYPRFSFPDSNPESIDWATDYWVIN